jgi:GNAT superfamily N-acetyltransferase
MSLIIASIASANLFEMSRPTSEPFDIFSPSAQERSHAISTVFGGSQQRATRYTSRSVNRKEELLFAINDARGNISNAALLTRSPGRTAMIFVTPPHNNADQDRGAALIRRAISAGNELDAVLVQALVEPLRSEELSMYSSGGMNPIGVLAYLELSRIRRPLNAGKGAPAGVTIRSWNTNDRTSLEELLEATYVDSLDCPGLAEMRKTSDILDGHISTGFIDPKKWLIAEVDGVPSGVSLMSEIPVSNCIEVVYFGLAPNARGRGVGGYLLDHALGIVQDGGGQSVALACDELNHPAMRLYQSRGFAMRLRRSALIGCVGK